MWWCSNWRWCDHPRSVLSSAAATGANSLEQWPTSSSSEDHHLLGTSFFFFFFFFSSSSDSDDLVFS
jgi:hypothetical protein